ncbi:MAG: hypothetical protein WC529_08830 [Candidatus Margulisiibacteriota bacterium]
MAEDAEILRRLTVIETQFEERWTAHDRASEDHWDGIKAQLNEIKTSIAGLVTCKEYGEALGGIRWQLKALWGVLSLASGAIMAFFNQHLGGGR